MKTIFLSITLIFVLSSRISACYTNNHTEIKKDTLVILIDDKSYTHTISLDDFKNNVFVNILICDRYKNDTITIIDLIGTGKTKMISAKNLKDYKIIKSRDIINAYSFLKLKEIMNIDMKCVYVIHKDNVFEENKKIQYYKKTDKTVTMYQTNLNYKNIKYD